MSDIDLIQQIEEQKIFIKRLQQAHQTQIKNIKSMLMHESIKHLKANCDKVVKRLTIEHHNIIAKFLAFKQRTLSDVDGRDYQLVRAKAEVIRYAIMNPVVEAFYDQHIVKKPLSLYDSLTYQIESATLKQKAEETEKKKKTFEYKFRRNVIETNENDKGCQTEDIDEYAIHRSYAE